MLDWSECFNNSGRARGKKIAVTQLHLLSGIPVPCIVVLLTVLLGSKPADLAIFLEVFGLLLQTLLGNRFSKQTKDFIVQQKQLLLLYCPLYSKSGTSNSLLG